MDITKGDWVVDDDGDVGQVDRVIESSEEDADEYEIVSAEVWCRWLRYRHAEGWKRQTITWVYENQIIGAYKKRLEAKAVATIIKSINREE